MSILEGLRKSSDGKRNGDQGGVTIQEAMKQLQGNPAEMIRAAGYQVPAEAASDPKRAVMHMIQTGQVGGPLMKIIGPMIARLGGGR